MSPVNVLIAFAAGVVSFLSPCVLPLVPGYISLISGLSFQELTAAEDAPALLKKSFSRSLLFVAGFTTVFVVLGVFASGLGSPLSAHMPLLRKMAGALIVLFGLFTLGVIPLQWLYRQKSIPLARLRPGVLGAFLMGAAFAFGWTPCVGPILASVLTLAATEGDMAKGAFLLTAYSLGLGIPFLLAGLGVGAFLKFFNRYKRYIRWGEWAAGALLIALGILIYFNKLNAVAGSLSALYRFSL